MDVVQAITLAVAVSALGLSVLNTYVQWQTYRRDKADIRVEVAYGFFGYDNPDGSRRAGDIHVSITATNVGRQPAGVNSMGFDTLDGRVIPLTEVYPGHTMPAVLQPGEHRAMWVVRDQLDGSLREEKTALSSAHVSGPGRQRWASKELGGLAGLGASRPRDG